MARLRIGVEQLGAEGLRVEIDAADGSTNVIELAPGGGIRGRYEQSDDAIGLHSIRAESLVVSELAWSWASGRVRGSLRLRDVAIESTIAIGDNPEGRPGFVGSIRARAVEGRLELRLGHTTWTAGGLELHDFELSAGASGRTELRVGRASVESLDAVLDEDGDVRIEANGLLLAEGLAIESGQSRVPAATVATARLRSAAPGTPSAPTWEPLEPSASSLPPRFAAQLPHPPRTPGELPLDGLRGRLMAAIETDVTAPVVGRRQATHAIDLVVDDGIIDYRDLENGLSTLEDMVLDFELEDDALVLEKDVPLVPFDNETLLRWPLGPEGIALAKEGKLRLATLLRPRGPEDETDSAAADPTSSEASPAPPAQEPEFPVRLHRLDVRDIDVELAVDDLGDLSLAGGTLRGAHPQTPVVEWLRLRGRLAHVPGETPPGSLVASARGIHATLEGLVVGGRRLGVGSLALEALEGAGLSLRGLGLGSVDARLRGLTLTSLTLDAIE